MSRSHTFIYFQVNRGKKINTTIKYQGSKKYDYIVSPSSQILKKWGHNRSGLRLKMAFTLEDIGLWIQINWYNMTLFCAFIIYTNTAIFCNQKVTATSWHVMWWDIYWDKNQLNLAFWILHANLLLAKYQTMTYDHENSSFNCILAFFFLSSNLNIFTD